MEFGGKTANGIDLFAAENIADFRYPSSSFVNLQALCQIEIDRRDSIDLDLSKLF